MASPTAEDPGGRVYEWLSIFKSGIGLRMPSQHGKESRMMKESTIPEPYRAIFRRLARRMPDEMLVEPRVMDTLLLYMKIGGEKLARHRGELFKKDVAKECVLFHRRLPDIPDAEDATGTATESVTDNAADGADADGATTAGD